MTKIYATFGSGNCFKPQLLLHQLSRPFSLQPVDVLSGETRAPNYLAMNPRGTVPFLVLSDGKTISESNAMLWVLGADSHLIPQTAYDQAKCVEWMIFEQTKLEPFISPARFFTTILPEKRDEMADQIKEWQQKGADGLEKLNAHLAEHAFILGDSYSIADIAVFGYTHVAAEGGFDMAKYPAVTAWIDRVAQTPDFLGMADLWELAMQQDEGLRAAG